MTTVLKTSPRQFVSTPAVERVALRAFRYLQSGYSVHLRGAAGTGKTTLALHLADLMARPIMLIFGDDEFKTSDLIGNQTGYTRKKVVDNYIHSVVKVEDEMRQHWVDSRLTLACREGFTLVYDEFNRSRPEVNNVLLSALEEKLLALPPNNNRSEYVRVSPHFRAVFTSNPEEYCGVHATQDALLDRLVTINMPEPDELTQQEIAVHKTQIDRESALMIIRLVKAFRTRTGNEKASGLRSALMLSKICVEHEILVMPENTEFREVCQDILLSRSGLSIEESTRILWHIFNEMIQADAMQSHSSQSLGHQSLGHQSLGHSVPDAIAPAHLANREIAYPESFIPAASIDYAPQSRVISRGADEAAEFGLTAIADSPDSEDFELPTEGLELGSVSNISVENFPQQSSGSGFSISRKSLKK